MDKVMEYCKKINSDTPIEKRSIRTVQGWLKVSMAAGALSAAKGNLDGPSLKAALESFRDWYPFNTPNALGRPGTTITDKDHRPSPIVNLYTIKDGKIVLLQQMNMKEKFPDKWESWLGW